MYFMFRDLWRGVGFGFGDVQQARVGLSFVKVSWVFVGVGVALGVIGMQDFLFEGVKLSLVGAHFGFGEV